MEAAEVSAGQPTEQGSARMEQSTGAGTLQGADDESNGEIGVRVSWLMPLAPSERPELLATTLKCLERQSLQANELLIAADGPLPSCLYAIIERSSLPIRLHNQSQNNGIGATLAVVGPQCLGDVIVRIDSDDLYAPEHTRTMVAAMQADPLLGAVGCQLVEIDTDRNRQRSVRKTPTNASEARRWLPWRNPLNHQTVALRRHALIQAGGYRHCPGFEDWDLWLRIKACGYQISNLPGCTAAARVNTQHLRRRRGWAYAWSEFQFYKRQINEHQIGHLIGMAALLTRLPWRLIPEPMLHWWMRSSLRGSPTLDSSWVTQLFEDTPRQTLRGKEQDR